MNRVSIGPISFYNYKLIKKIYNFSFIIYVVLQIFQVESNRIWVIKF